MEMIMPGTQRIESARLTLRPFDAGDGESILRNWISDKEIQSNYGEPVCKTLEEARQYIARVCAQYERGDYYRWIIVEKASDECIGQIAFYDMNIRHRTAEVEYCIGKAFQRQGYAVESLKAVVAFSFAQTSIDRIQAFHRGRNPISGKVLLRAGLKYEGTQKGAFRYQDSGEIDDKVCYGLSREEYALSPGGSGERKQDIVHIALVVRDYDEAIDFYTKKLHFTVLEDSYQPEQDKRWVVVSPPGSSGTTILLARASKAEQNDFIGNQSGGRVFLFLNSDDFWRDYDEMVSRGIEFVRPPKEADYGMVAVFKDLYGNLWDLLQMNPDHPISRRFSSE